MSEEPPNFPDPVPTNHGRFEGPASHEDYKAVKGMGKMVYSHAAQLKFQERLATEALAEREADKIDAVTGVLKREVFRREADYKLAKLKEEKRHMSPNNAIIGNFDGKGLKETNDTKGHAEGDKVLFNLGRIISAVAREDDLVGRGGDGSDEYGAVYFFRDDIISPETLIERLNLHLLALVKTGVSRGDISGLKWKLVPYQQDKDINELLHLADPIPGSEGLMEWPPPDVLPSRK